MGPVMVRCPKTGSSIRTGIVTDHKSFNATPVFFGRVHCPICRTVHEWFAKDAWVSEAEPAPPRLKKIRLIKYANSADRVRYSYVESLSVSSGDGGCPRSA